MPAIRVSALLLLATLVVGRRTLAPLPLAVDDRSNVQQAHDSSNNGVCDNVATLCTSQLQAKTAIHHSEDDGDATNADVGVRYGRAATIFLEVPMVEETAKRLCEEDDEQHDTDDRVCASKVLAVHGDPDTDAECYNVDEEADDLQSSVHPDKTREACGSDHNTTDGEEADESKRGHDTVCEDHGVTRAAEGAVAAVLGELRVA